MTTPSGRSIADGPDESVRWLPPAGPGPGDEPHHRLLTLLSSGRLVEAEDLLRTLPDDVPFTAVARFDLRMRTMDCEAPELERLAESVRDAVGDGPVLWAWARALAAERVLLDFDRRCFAMADGALATLPDDRQPPRLALYVRARLRRMRLARPLFDETGQEPDRLWLAHTLGDFRRAGFLDEAVLTTALVAAVEGVQPDTDVASCIERIRTARRLLDDDRSLWPMLLDHALLLVCAVRGERAVRDQTRLELRRYRDVPPFLAFVQLLAAQFLISEAPDDDPFQRWSRALGAPSVEPVATAPAPVAGAPDDAERELLILRLEIQAGNALAAGEIIAVLERVAPLGRPEALTEGARLIADDLTATGAADAAAAVERWLARNGTGGRQGPEGHPVVIVRVLRPLLEVLVDGRIVPVGDAAAGLLVSLAARAPAPVHVEEIGELLWPGQAPPVTRRRLNSLVHRLRTRQPAVGDLIVRAGPTVALDTERCEVDLLRYRAALERGADDRLDALVSVAGNLCHAQFPYDEHLVEERHRLAADWWERAEAAAGGDPTISRLLEPARRALGL